MKTYAYILTVLTAAMLSTPAFGTGADTSAYQGALFNGDSTEFFDTVHSGGPRLFSVGIDIQGQRREVEREEGFENELEANHVTAIVGFDATKWLTVYGGAGESDVALGGNNRSSNFGWLAGGDIRILDYLVLEPWNDIDQYWVGLNVNSYFRSTKVDSGYDSSDTLSELFSSLTLSFYSKPEKPGSWNRVGFYIGPALSFLDYGDQNESQMIGFLGGIRANPSANLSLKIEVQQFDDTSLGAGVTFHF